MGYDQKIYGNGLALNQIFNAIVYHKLRQYLGLPPKPVRVYDIVQQLAIVDEDVLDRFGIDTIEMGRGFLLEEKDWKDWVLPDKTPCKIPYYINVEKRSGDCLGLERIADECRRAGPDIRFSATNRRFDSVI